MSATCGYVTVPEKRNDQVSARTIRIAIAVLRDVKDPRMREPATLLLGGGPGQNVIGLFAAMLREHSTFVHDGFPSGKYPGHLEDMQQARAVFDLLISDLRKRDLVLIDQRGAGLSQPSLRCRVESWSACYARLTNAGIDLSAYNTIENAADIEDIRRALGYHRVDLQAGSYGTRLALEIMRRYPNAIRAVVLDGVAPPQVQWAVEMARRYDDALDVLFDHCAADSVCARVIPSLESSFYRLVERLNQQPLAVAVGKHTRSINGNDLRGIVWNALYHKPRIRFVPAMIHELEQGRSAILSGILESFATAADSIAWGMHYSVECAERWNFNAAAVAAAAAELPRAIRDDVVREFTSTFNVCRQWRVPKADALAHAPVRSDIPTLLISGEFDPGTPPAFAADAARDLSRHFHIVLPNEGHCDGFFSVCHAAIVSHFLDNPRSAPDTQCAARAQGSPFLM